jgi:hypothetical protein
MSRAEALRRGVFFSAPPRLRAIHFFEAQSDHIPAILSLMACRLKSAGRYGVYENTVGEWPGAVEVDWDWPTKPAAWAIREFKGSRVQEFKGSRVQGFKSSRVQEFKGSRGRGFKGSRVQGFKGSRVQGFKGSSVQGFGEEEGLGYVRCNGVTTML